LGVEEGQRREGKINEQQLLPVYFC
jgi:hypothetical protein